MNICVFLGFPVNLFFVLNQFSFAENFTQKYVFNRKLFLITSLGKLAFSLAINKAENRFKCKFVTATVG